MRLEAVSRRPFASDDVAIATVRREAGTRLVDGSHELVVAGDVLESHRLAVAPIAAGTKLSSCGAPLGVALRDVAPGHFVCNAATFEALRVRDLDATLPDEANVEGHGARFVLDPATFTPVAAPTPLGDGRSFLGFERPGGRGVGTRNHLVTWTRTAQLGDARRYGVRRFTRPGSNDTSQLNHDLALTPQARGAYPDERCGDAATAGCSAAW